MVALVVQEKEIRMSKKKIENHPDEFVSVMDQIVQVVFKDHKQTTQILLSLALLVLIGLTAYHYYSESKMNTWAEKIYAVRVLPQDKKVEKLLALEKENPPKDLSSYLNLELAKAYLKDKRKEDAKTAYRNVYESRKSDLSSLAGLSLAALLIEDEKWDEAEQIYSEISSKKTDALSSEAHLQWVRVLMEQNKRDLASAKLLELEVKAKDLDPALQASIRSLKLSLLLQKSEESKPKENKTAQENS